MEIKSLIKACAFFLAGYITVAILEYFIWDVLAAMGIIFSSTELDQTMSWGIILIYIALTIIAPTIYLYKAISTESTLNGYAEAALGLLIFALGTLFIIKTWYMTDTLANITTEPLVIALFWIGYIIAAGGALIAAPIYMIIHGMTNPQ